MIHNPNLIIETTLPIPAEHMRKYLENKDIRFQYDLSQSKITEPKVQLTFLTNAGMPGWIDFSTLNEEQILALLKEWLNHTLLTDIEPLPAILAKILLHACEIPNRIPVPKNITTELMDKFLLDEAETIRDWITFIDSTLHVYIEHAMRQTADTIEEYSGHYPVIDQRDLLSPNIVTLLSVPEFLLSMLSVPPSPTNLFYFKKQFEEFMFKGQKLLDYLQKTCNLPMLSVMEEIYQAKWEELATKEKTE